MHARATLQLLFAAILVTMIGVTTWASVRQPVWQWGGLAQAPDNGWTLATQLRRLPKEAPMAALLTARHG